MRDGIEKKNFFFLVPLFCLFFFFFFNLYSILVFSFVSLERALLQHFGLRTRKDYKWNLGGSRS